MTPWTIVKLWRMIFNDPKSRERPFGKVAVASRTIELLHRHYCFLGCIMNRIARNDKEKTSVLKFPFTQFSIDFSVTCFIISCIEIIV